MAQATFCADIRQLLKAVSVVMAADEGRQGLEDGSANRNIADTTEGANFLLSEVLCDVLAGVDGGVIASLLREALEAYAAGDNIVPRGRNAAAASAPVLLRTLALLAEASGNVSNRIDERDGAGQPGGSSNRERLAGRSGQHGAGDREEQLRTLAGSQGLFWRRLEQRMEDIERDERGEEARGRGQERDLGQLRRRGLGVSVEQYHGGVGGVGGGVRSGRGDHDHRSAAPDAISELSELLRVFQLLATRSLLSPENSAALEALVFPAALSRRRLIREAVGLALALEQPHRVLLSSLAILQDAAFARSSTDVGSRACDYVRLIGVLARENASIIAAHIREQYSGRSSSRGGENESAETGEDDYLAGVSNREAMEREIRRLRESSVTSDGMLSCYTPFLLAIVRRRVADMAAAKSVMAEKAAAATAEGGEEDGEEEDEFMETGSAGGTADGDCGGARSGGGGDTQDKTRYHMAQEDGGKVEAAPVRKDVGQDRGSATAGVSIPASSCPWTLCSEALWALSEYAVLSPGLAAVEVLPLAEGLASDTMEHPQIRNAAVGVLTRRELATDEIAAHACSLLEDENPCLRREVLIRLGQLMKESRIKTAHLSRFALMLVDVSERVRQAAQKVFRDHLQPRPDTVCSRCLFETYFTLDAEEPVKRQVLQRLVAVAREAAPGQGLESLGGALVRKAGETGDSEAAFFLSLVPPTVNSFEAAEVALRRGQLAQSPHGTISLVATHFSRGAQRGAGSSLAATASIAGRGGGAPLSKAQALEMAAQIGSLASRGASASRPSRRATVAAAAATGAAARNTAPATRPRRGKKTKQAAATQGREGYDSGSDDVSLTSIVGCQREDRYTGRRGSDKGARKKSGGSKRGSKKRRRARETSRTRAGGARGGKANAKANKEKGDDSMDISEEGDGREQGEEDEEEDEEEQWQG
ncbi:unnamed protein product [Ectocarpus fasciculatus]